MLPSNCLTIQFSYDRTLAQMAGMDGKKSAEKEADTAQQVMGLTIDI